MLGEKKHKACRKKLQSFLQWKEDGGAREQVRGQKEEGRPIENQQDLLEPQIDAEYIISVYLLHEQ